VRGLDLLISAARNRRSPASLVPDSAEGCRGGDRFAGFDLRGHGQVQVKKLGQEILLGRKSVGVQHGRVERGVGVFERVLAGQLQRAIHGAQPARASVSKAELIQIE
jgi:hypothetical protein